MAVKIDKISIKESGPLENFSVKFGLFNLIYSQNEKGKTFLTEFIIRSLFKNIIRRWGHLRKEGTGKIWVSGFGKNLIEFSPLSRKKLEDYWETDERGLPLSLTKLLVVKGGKAEIEETEGGVGKFLIKDILSGKKILDKIDDDKNISKTVKSARIIDGRIDISQKSRMGEDYNNLRNELYEIGNLFEEVESQYPSGTAAAYKIKKESLKKQLEELNKAKCHEACLASEKIRKVEIELSKIPEEELSRLETALSLYRSKKEHYDKLEKDSKEALDKSKDSNWLRQALSKYKELNAKFIEFPSNNWLIIGGLTSAITIISILSKQIFASVISFAGTLIFIGIYIKKLYDSSKCIGQREELNKIKSEFKKRTGKELTDIVLLETISKEQEEFNTKSDVIKKQLEALDGELRDSHFSIKQKLFVLAKKEIEESEWHIVVGNLKQDYTGFRENIDKLKEKLYKLGVDESDYLEEDIKVKYSQERYKAIESRFNDIQKRIENQEKQLNELKYKIGQKTKDDMSVSWENIIENLRKKRQVVKNELKEVTAKIIAGNTVHKIISQLREEENVKIQEGLQSKTVLKPLKDLTQRYNKITLDDDKVTISDDYDNFSLSDLSTGAKEQVMLALRIGFSSKILNQDTLFLILDDAFQHCDWRKREILVKYLANIARKGWQIIYLTMDKHIKGLFNEIGKEFKEGGYKDFELK